MALITITDPEPTAADGAADIREAVRQAASALEQALDQVHEIVTEFGRGAIDQELGSDAGELQTVYDDLKQSLLVLDSTQLTPDLPL
jgi:hypothetical protein